MAASSEDSFLQDWVKKQLDAGDDPEVLKTVLKNRGMDPSIVDSIHSIKNGSQSKNNRPTVSQPETAVIVECENDAGAGAKEQIAPTKDVPKDKAQEPKKDGWKETFLAGLRIKETPKESALQKQVQKAGEKSIFSLFLDRASDFTKGFKLGSPKLTEYLFDTRIVLLAGIAVAILVIALLASFGLNWYADWAARSVLN